MPLVVGVLELIGYREWTESLGSDREWRIQITQARLYASVQEEASRVGGFLAPLSYDVMLLVANGLSVSDIERVYRVAEKASPVPVSLLVTELGSGVNGLRVKGSPGLRFETRELGYPVAAIHVDLNSFTARRRVGALNAYLNVLSTYTRLASKLVNAVPAYLGGDNIAVFVGAERLEETVGKVLGLLEPEYKVGVGVACNARQALAAAAKALEELRTRRDRRVAVVKEC